MNKFDDDDDDDDDDAFNNSKNKNKISRKNSIRQHDDDDDDDDGDGAAVLSSFSIDYCVVPVIVSSSKKSDDVAATPHFFKIKWVHGSPKDGCRDASITLDFTNAVDVFTSVVKHRDMTKWESSVNVPTLFQNLRRFFTSSPLPQQQQQQQQQQQAIKFRFDPSKLELILSVKAGRIEINYNFGARKHSRDVGEFIRGLFSEINEQVNLIAEKDVKIKTVQTQMIELKKTQDNIIAQEKQQRGDYLRALVLLMNKKKARIEKLQRENDALRARLADQSNDPVVFDDSISNNTNNRGHKHAVPLPKKKGPAAATVAVKAEKQQQRRSAAADDFLFDDGEDDEDDEASNLNSSGKRSKSSKDDGGGAAVIVRKKTK